MEVTKIILRIILLTLIFMTNKANALKYSVFNIEKVETEQSLITKMSANGFILVSKHKFPTVLDEGIYRFSGMFYGVPANLSVIFKGFKLKEISSVTITTKDNSIIDRDTVCNTWIKEISAKYREKPVFYKLGAWESYDWGGDQPAQANFEIKCDMAKKVWASFWIFKQ